MRSPLESAPLICSITLRTASSTSAKARWVWRKASVSISSDLVMERLNQMGPGSTHVHVLSGTRPSWPRPRCRLIHEKIEQSLRLVHLLFQQRTELGGRTAGVLVVRQRLGQLVLVLGTDGQLQHAALAIHADELG